MLTQLLQIKRQRERGVRRALAQRQQQLASLCARAAALRAELPLLLAAQRALQQQSGCYPPAALARLRAALDQQRQALLALAHERQQLAQAQVRVQAEQVALQQALRRLLQQQEKLRFLMEQT